MTTKYRGTFRYSNYLEITLQDISSFKRCLYGILIFIFFLSQGYSQVSPISAQIAGQTQNSRPIITAVPFLTFTPDARSAGMGETGVATSPDPFSSHWNPSKLAFIDHTLGGSVSFTPWMQKVVGDMSLSHLTMYNRIGKNEVVAISLLYFDLGSMTLTSPTGAIINQFDPREYYFDASYSRKLSKRFSIAGTARFIYSNLTGNIGASLTPNDSKPAQTFAVDISSFYTNEDIHIANYPSIFSLGINISNIGDKITYTDSQQEDFIPTNLRLGTAVTSEINPLNTLTLTLDLNKLLVPTPQLTDSSTAIIVSAPNNIFSGIAQSFNDAPNGFEEELQEVSISSGIEYWYNDLFALRGGYFHEHRRKGNRQYFTVGLGIRYQVIGVDFAYLIARKRNHPLEDTLRFSLLVNFDRKRTQDEFLEDPDSLF